MYENQHLNVTVDALNKDFSLIESYYHSEIISEGEMANLPEIVLKWLAISGVDYRDLPIFLRIEQHGKLRLKPNGKWLDFRANQIINSSDPSFIWQSRVKFLPLIKIYGRDRFVNGKGKMRIRLGPYLTILNQRDNEKINSATMLRFLGEICWFPHAALRDYIKWKGVDALSAKAIFSYKGESVTGLFKFNEDGRVSSFEADRYFGSRIDSKKAKWLIEVIDYGVFDEIVIPSKCNVYWKLPSGDFHWLQVSINSAHYNNSDILDT